MSNFTQITFLGSSVRNFNCSVGWGTSPSTLDVNLVDDPKNGDSFIRPSPGTPVFFATSDFEFGGIVQSWTQNRDTNGNPLYTVVIHDPREILSGVQLILNSYTGGIYGVPNLYNIYGALESIAFGYSGINEAGIEWYKIRNAFLTLQNTTKIRLGQHDYTVDLSFLPALPNYYRIGGDSISLLDFIADICDAASRDYFFRLTSDNVLTLYTVDRSFQPGLGYIESFIQGQEELVRGNSGYELRNDTTSKFLTGGPIHELYFVWHTGGDTDDFKDDSIAPYWGLDYDGNIVEGFDPYFENEHNFDLDSIRVDVVGIGDTYSIDVGEMRAALHSQESWELYLLSKSMDPDSIHAGKSTKIGLLSDKSLAWVSGLPISKIASLTPVEFLNLTRSMIRDTAGAVETLHEHNVARLYEAVSSYASEYYGRKFIVSASGIQVKQDEFTNQFISNWEPADGAYVNEVNFSGAVSSNLLPEALSFITLDDGRISGFAKFENYENLDFADLSPEDYRISKGCLFVKCDVEPGIKFFNISGVTDPRFVVSLPGAVYRKTDATTIKSYNSLFKNLTTEIASAASGLTTSEAESYINAAFLRFGGEFLFDGQVGQAEYPAMIALPLKSNTLTYGPWYAVGANGKTEFENDVDLVPWNYGGYAAMNLAAYSRVSSALTNMQIAEGGTLEVTGLPAVLLGGELIAGGPLVTDISCDVGQNGVTTSYRMQTWTPRFGKVAKQFTDRMQKIALKNEKIKRNLRNNEFLKNNPRIQAREFRNTGWVKRKTASSSMQIAAGEYIQISGETGKINVVFAPPYNVATHTGSGIEQKTAASLDTLFIPFTTDPSSIYLPHFSEAETSGINNDTLNPFGKNLFNVVLREHLAEDHTQEPSGHYQGVAFRSPIIVGGWGYDIQGNPVPGISGEFIEDYAEKPKEWKVGPVDLRWDDKRACWQAGGGSVLIGRMQTTLHYRSSGIVDFYEMTASGLQSSGESDWVYDWLLSSGNAVYAGKNIMFSFIDDRYYVVSAEESC